MSVEPWDPDAGRLGRRGRVLGARCTPPPAWPATRDRGPSIVPRPLLRALRRAVRVDFATAGRSWARCPVPAARDLLPPARSVRPARRSATSSGSSARCAASHGCAHRCRHCPVPVVYDGRVAPTRRGRGARRHRAARRRRRAAHHLRRSRLPQRAAALASRSCGPCTNGSPMLTFDCTVKVEHVLRYGLRHADLWPEFAAAGCLFVVSAFESVDDAILDRLDKGHTAADAARAVAILRAAGHRRAPVVAAVHAVDHARRRGRAARLRARARPRRQRRPGAVHRTPAAPPGFAAPRAPRPRTVPRPVGRRAIHVHVGAPGPGDRRAAAHAGCARRGRR